jgi:hypothetical protein
MEKSKLESLPDKQLIQYIKYVLKTIEGHSYNSLVEFYEIFNDDKLFSKIAAPIGKGMSRLDIEYIYWILEHNDTDTDTFERPTLTTKEVTHVEEFVVPKTIQRSKDLPTYVSDEVGSYYLNQLVVNDEIDIFNWEVVFDKEGDFDLIEVYFIVK